MTWTLLWQVADRVAVLADGKVQGVGSMTELSGMDQPSIRQFFDGPRGRAAQPQDQRLAAGQTRPTTGSPPSKPR